MSKSTAKHDGQCACGAVTLTIDGPPLLRAYCHCATCRDYNGSEEPADIIVFRASDVTVGNEAGVDYRGYQKPALAQRGRCTSCERPALERAHVPLLPPIVMVPSDNVRREGLLPPPSMHIFYDRRVRDAHDGPGLRELRSCLRGPRTPSALFPTTTRGRPSGRGAHSRSEVRSVPVRAPLPVGAPGDLSAAGQDG